MCKTQRERSNRQKPHNIWVMPEPQKNDGFTLGGSGDIRTMVLPWGAVETSGAEISLCHIVVSARGTRVGEGVTLLCQAVVASWTWDWPGCIEWAVVASWAQLAGCLSRLILKLPHRAWRGLRGTQLTVVTWKLVKHSQGWGNCSCQMNNGVTPTELLNRSVVTHIVYTVLVTIEIM